MFEMKFFPNSRYSSIYKFCKPSILVNLLKDKLSLLNLVNPYRPSIYCIWLFDNDKSSNEYS